MKGQKILHYQILEKLGEGGMGIVYLAEDTKLKRRVAIKLLPRHITRNSDERKRFEMEAQAAAALNHANIATIHAIEESDDELFLVLEYINGKHLRDGISSTPLTADKAMAIALQIAEGLATAHKEDVIHRDIKSTNIMITPDDKVKIMDFGLAKFRGRGQLTKVGTTLGTAAYMSPEQVRGGDVDQRSDIWSFGMVFYEMLTGCLPFTGDYDQAVMYATLNDEPTPVTQYVPDISPELLYIMDRLLEKDPADRYQNMDEVINALKRAQKKSSRSMVSIPAMDPVQTRPRKSNSRLVYFAGGAAVILILAGYFGFFYSAQTDYDLPAMKTIRLTSYPGEEYFPSLSPDGKSIAFSWNGPDQDNFDIYIKLVNGGNPIRLTTNPLADIRPEWSPDGNYIAFVREYPFRPETMLKEIFVIPALGGREQDLVKFHPGLDERPSISWSVDSKYIYLSSWSVRDTAFAIHKVSLETKESEQVEQLPAGVWGDQSPRISPDGQYLAFERGQPYRRNIEVLDLGNGKVHTVYRSATMSDGYAWLNDSRSLVFAANIDGASALWMTDISGSRPRKLLSGINVNNPGSAFQVNRLVYAETIQNSNIWQIDLRDPGKESMLISSSTFHNLIPDISPDGQNILFSSDRTGRYNIWMCERDGSNQTPLTSFETENSSIVAIWSPSGTRILITDGRKSYLLNASGGSPQPLFDNKFSFLTWAGNENGFYFSKYPENEIWFISVDSMIQKQITKNGGIMPVFRQNYVYYVKSWDLHDIWRVPADGGVEEAVLTGVSGFGITNWTVTKRGIYYIRQFKGTHLLEYYDLKTKKVKRIKELPLADPSPFTGIAVDKDEHYLLYTRCDDKSDIILVDNVGIE